MNMEEFRAYCLSKKRVIESFPFDQSTLVFKVMDKMFALSSLDNIERTANLKCNPYYAEELIDHSYDLVVAKLPKKRKEDLSNFK